MLSPDRIDRLCAGSETKLHVAKEALLRCGSVLVAFSGGVDSTLVLQLAAEVLPPDRRVALTAISPAVPAEEREAARALARRIGAEHLEVDSAELSNPEYAKNPTNRCYHCKTELYSLCEVERSRRGLSRTVDGFNADDRRDHRPGHQAAREHEVLSPLALAELTKDEVRAWSHRLGLPTWDKPAAPCLASRIPYGTQVTAERLVRIGRAEAAVRGLGFRVFRVRFHDELARLELSEDELPRLAEPGVRQELTSALKGQGFKFVAVDLEPFRSGRLNEAAGVALPVLG